MHLGWVWEAQWLFITVLPKNNIIVEWRRAHRPWLALSGVECTYHEECTHLPYSVKQLALIICCNSFNIQLGGESGTVRVKMSCPSTFWMQWLQSGLMNPDCHNCGQKSLTHLFNVTNYLYVCFATDRWKKALLNPFKTALLPPLPIRWDCEY